MAKAVTLEGRYRETILLMHVGAAQEDYTALDGLPVIDIPVRRVESFCGRPANARLRDNVAGADLVHIHGLWEPHCAIAARWARRLGKPYIVSAHGMLERWALRNKWWKKLPYFWLVERPALAKAACLRAVTRMEAEDYRACRLPGPIAVVPHGIAIPEATAPAPFWERFSHLRGRRLILFLGRIHYKKGVDLLCRAWAKVSPAFPDAHLVLAGPDFEGTQKVIEQLVAALGISQQVTFTGMLEGELKWSALAAAQVFVLPSRSEGLPVAVLEAIGAGKPVIITQQCNLPEVVERQCGIVIEPDVRQLEAALQQLLSMPSGEAIRMGNNGRCLVSERYDWRAVGRQMARVYDWLLGGPQPEGVEIH